MREDFVAVVEAAYRVEQPERDWLRGCFDAARPLLDHGLGFNAHTFDSTETGEGTLRELLVSGPPGLEEQLRTSLSRLPPPWVLEVYRNRMAGFGSELESVRRFMAEAAARGMPLPGNDVFGVNGIDASGSGCQLAAGIAHAEMGREERALWSRIAAYLASGLRLQRALAAGGAKPQAVMKPTGQVVDAEPAADQRATRELLSSTCRARARLPPEV